MTEVSKPSFYRGFIQGKTRIVLAWIFSAVLIFSASEPPILEGIVICFLGATLRFWASGYLHKDKQVSVFGPYAFMRNPLYFGTLTMAVGTAIAVDNWWLAVIVAVAFTAVYHFIILDEENKLRGYFGPAYEKYLKTVPRFFPRLTMPGNTVLSEINPDAAVTRFSWDIAMQNKAYEAYAAFAGLIGFVTIVALVRRAIGI